MKRPILKCVLLLIALYPLMAEAQMRELYRDGSANSNKFQELSFYNASSGFLAALNENQSTLFYTTDSGQTYLKRKIRLDNVNFNGYLPNLTFGFYIQGVRAFNSNNVVVYGDYGFVPSILHSSDGGQTFTLVFHSQFNPMLPNSSVESMVFPEGNIVGYAVDRDRILKTIDGGLQWTVIRTDQGRQFTQLDAIDDNNVFAFGTEAVAGKLFKTSNGGVTWQEINRPVGTTIQFVDFISGSKGWLLAVNTGTQAGEVYHTTDAGSTWTLMNNPEFAPYYFQKFTFLNDSTGFAIAEFNTYRTTDTGKIWETLPREFGLVLPGYGHHDLQFIGDKQLFAGGDWQVLEINTNLAGEVIPAANFEIDTSGYASLQTVRLINHSKLGYSYAWYLNNQLISTNYHYSYTHDPFHPKDTIRLVVSNSKYNALFERVVNFGAIPKPVINTFFPASASQGSVITIKGRYLSKCNQISFGGFNATSFTIVSDTLITATVSDGGNGKVNIEATNGSVSVDGFTFIPPAPVISSISTMSATPGTLVTIKGNFFQGLTSLSIGAVPVVSFKVISQYEVRFILGKVPSGTIEVVTSTGAVFIPDFTVLPLVTISGFSPHSGVQGSTVTINGEYFDTSKAENVVYFGGVEGIVTNATPTQLTVIVPNGAMYAPISVIVRHQVVATTLPFLPTFNGTDTLSNRSFYIDTTVFVQQGTKASGKLGDLDLDGRLDLVTGTTSIFRNISTAGKIKMIKALQLSGARHISLQDMNGDGRLDVVTSELGINIYRNIASIGDIKFEGARSVPGVINSYSEPVLQDFDLDGRPDIAAFASSGGLLVFRNSSNPDSISFESAIQLPVGDGPWGCVAGDLDGDGKAELILSNYFEANIFIYRNESIPGKLSFAAPQSFMINNDAVRNLCIGDLDKDGRLDIAAVSIGMWQSYVAILKNTTHSIGSFSFAPIQNVPAGGDAYSIEMSDLDGDENLDLITANQSSYTVSLIRNRGALSFSEATLLTTGSYAYPNAGLVGDLDNDGKADVVAVNYMANSFICFRNRIGETLANAGRDTVFCLPGHTVTIGSPGVSGYSYRWTSQPEGFNSTLAMPAVSPTQSTYYFLEVTSSFNVQTKDTVFVNIQRLIADAGPDQIFLCKGTATVVGSATVPGVVYNWTSRPAGFIATDPRPPIYPIENTTYFMEIKSAAGCSAIDSVHVLLFPYLTTSVSISADSVLLSGNSTLINAIPVNGGTIPQFKWQDSTAAHDWKDIVGVSGNQIAYQPTSTGDAIRCQLTSNAICPSPIQVFSNTIRFEVNIPTSIRPVNPDRYGIKFYPNPASSVITIDSLNFFDHWQWCYLMDAEGRQLRMPISISGKQQFHVNIMNLSNGRYWLVLINKNNKRVIQGFIKN